MNIFKRSLSYLARPLTTLLISDLHGRISQATIIASRSNSSNFQDLWDSEVSVYSQWGEDGILDYCCEQLNIVKPKILEIGAGKFQECNSRFLAENRNASVFAVDGRGDLEASINLSSLKWKTHLFAMQAWVTQII